jgi:hypothetical protein
MGITQSTTPNYDGCMCYLCRFENIDWIGTCDMQQCGNTNCKNQMSSGSYKICMECSTKEEKCYQCGKSINFDNSELENHIAILTKSKDSLCKSYERIKSEGFDPSDGIKKHYINVHHGLIGGKRNFI